MYRAYRTCAVMMHAIALPVDLFQVAAVCAGKPFNYDAGTNMAQKLKQSLLSEKEKQNLYVQEIMQTIPDHAQSLISNHPQVYYDRQTNELYRFNYQDDMLVVTQRRYDDILKYPAIQPNDLILNFYYFPQFQEFTQLLPQAIKQWSENDVRVQEMQRTIALVKQANMMLQSLVTIREQPMGSFGTLYADTSYAIVQMPAGVYRSDLKTRDSFVSTEEILNMFHSKGYRVNPRDIENIQKPITKEGDWMTQLRVRDNHFRSIHDVFRRVLEPLATVCKEKYLSQWFKMSDKNQLRVLGDAITNVFMVALYGVDPIHPDGIVVIGDKFVPVFIYEEDGFDERLNAYRLTLYSPPKISSREYSISKLSSQPFYDKPASELLCMVLDFQGISVWSFDGQLHLRVTYAKLTEKTLADILRVFTNEE
jgi:hypothetical protein